MRIADLMTKRVICVTPNDTLAVAREHFRTNSIHHLIVIERGRPVGVVSIRDVLSKPPEVAIETVMARNIVTVGPESSTRDVAAAMIGRGHGCVPVVDAGRVVGVVTTTDLLRVLSGRGIERAVAV